jgi:phospholipid/cholesterol/gamma-HCH transport system substrate-binding protein
MKRSLNTAKMNIRVGIMSIIAFAILVWVLFFPVRGVSSFSSKVLVTGYYTRVDGLRRNAPVYYEGIEVGSVKSVSVEASHPDAPLKVVVSVEERVVPLLPKSTTMEIVARGLLGDVFVDMVPGPKGPSIADGDELATKPYESVLSGMNELSGSLKGAVEELKTMFARANAGEGTVGRLLREDELYVELTKAVHQTGLIAERLAEMERTINEKLLDKSAKEGVDNAIATAGRVLKRADEITQKASDLHWYLGVGVDKYESTLSSAFADVTIVPNKDKFYRGGIDFYKTFTPVGPADYSSAVGGYLGYDAYLGLRVLNSPIFFRGGLRRTSVDMGLDLRINDIIAALPVEFSADLSKYSQPTAQMDLNASYTLIKLLKFSGGADDVLNTPRWRAGLSLIYDDEDLTSILIKSKL